MAENLCALWLLCKGYAILALRHRNRGGEIDIIARRGSVLVFVEVKARAAAAEGLASITPEKQQRILRAAEAFIAGKRMTQHGLRFDVMLLTSGFHITHLKDAWRAQ